METTASPAGGRRLILGLGNPGEEYRATRHNAGFRVVEALARRWGAAWTPDTAECRSRLAEAVVGGGSAGTAETTVLLARPWTYMNRSGYAARCLVERWDLPVADLLVVYDELALPLGRLRLRPGGSPAGHRGLESILQNLRTAEVPRLRLGIGPADGSPVAGDAVVDYVLSPFAASEEESVEEMIERAADACEHWLGQGIEAAMNQFNG